MTRSEISRRYVDSIEDEHHLDVREVLEPGNNRFGELIPIERDGADRASLALVAVDRLGPW